MDIVNEAAYLSYDFRKYMELESDSKTGLRRYYSLKCGPVYMSIQASEFHYCKPRETLPLNLYTSMEVAIFDDGAEWPNLYHFAPLLTYPRRDEVLELYEGDEEYYNASVIPYMPIDLIWDLFNWLRKKYE